MTYLYTMQRLFFFVLTIIIGIILWASFSQDTVDDLKGDFREVAFYRNENNTGPIIRKYIVTLSDTLWQEMKQYGNMMPYTKYGGTTVYFFLQGTDLPDDLDHTSPGFDKRYQPYCIGKYDRNTTGVTSFTRYPFGS